MKKPACAECRSREGWIPFRPGSYVVEEAFLINPDHQAVGMREAVIEVFVDPAGVTRMNGKGFVRNALMVDLVGETDRVDILLVMGDDLEFLLAAPEIQGGKVFSPDTESIVHFAPTGPLRHLSAEEAAKIHNHLNPLSF